MEIPWPSWFLPIHPGRFVRAVRAWRRRRRLGLPPLRTPVVTSIPEVDRSAFARSGYVPREIDVLPYERQAMDYLLGDQLLDLDDESITVDDDGVAVWLDSRGARQDHPVYLVQYALAALGGYTRTGDARYLDRALANAERLVSLSQPDESGALWFPYHFAHRYYDVTMPVPWWSSMGQGQPLSLFCRLARLRGSDTRWLALAHATFRTFESWRTLGRPWITTMDAHGRLWFEEYAGDVEPLLVVNGHIFALYGLYDYAMLTEDQRAIEFFDGGATTVRECIDTFRVPGGVSYYCVREGYCQRPEWQNASYHPIHIQQLRVLARMTGDETFENAARDLETDVPPA